MKILPPSQETLRIKRALSSAPRKALTAEQAKQQVKEHLREATEEMSRNGPVADAGICN